MLFDILSPGFSLTLHPGLYCAVPLALVLDSSTVYAISECNTSIDHFFAGLLKLPRKEKKCLFDVLFYKIKSYLSLIFSEVYAFSILNTLGFIQEKNSTSE